MKAMQQGFQRMISLALGDALGAKKKDLMPLLNVVSKSCGARRKKDIRTVRILMLMAKHLHELNTCGAIFVSLTFHAPSTPCLTFMGESIEEADDLFLPIDKHRLLGTIDEGVTAVMAACGLFDTT
nr:uncharacterized protein LOC129383623 [Dermacentor andersoni]